MSDGRTLVAVYAGAAGNDPSVGRLVVVRQNLASGAQTVRIARRRRDRAARDHGGSARQRSDGPGRVGIRSADRGGRELRLDLGESRNPHKKLTNRGYVGRPPAAPIE